MPYTRYITKLILICTICFVQNSIAQYDTLNHDGLERSYFVHVPSSYSNGDSIPLIIAMHGGFGSAANLQVQSQLNVKADNSNFIVVYPEGVKNLLNIRTWNGGACCGYAVNQNIDDVGFISTLIDSLQENYSIDSDRIYATAISNGGYMAYRLACELSDKIAAIAPVSASMNLPTCTPERAVPIIHFQSYLDDNIPYLGGYGNGPSDHYNPPLDSIFNVWGNLNNCTTIQDTLTDNDEYTLVQWSDGDCNAEINYYITQDGGHSWHGGNATVIGDDVSTYISANDLMWAFFQEHSMDCSELGIEEATNQNPVKIFPNPSTGIIYLELPNTTIDYQVYISDLTGRTIEKYTRQKEIDLRHFPKGLYTLSIKSHSFNFEEIILLQ